LSELVEQVASRIAALPAPKNGQVRAVPDERTVRYYGTIGLLDKPLLRGRTALYGSRHLAQVVAIKRLQTMGRSLAEIQAMWPKLDDETLARMSGVALPAKGRAARTEFWKRAPAPAAVPVVTAPARPASAPVEVRVELAPNVVITIAMPETGIALSSADVRAIRAAAAPLVAELAHRRLTPHAGEEEP
jgi:DNA-binding transcriptional MerR regulator